MRQAVSLLLSHLSEQEWEQEEVEWEVAEKLKRRLATTHSWNHFVFDFVQNF